MSKPFFRLVKHRIFQNRDRILFEGFSFLSIPSSFCQYLLKLVRYLPISLKWLIRNCIKHIPRYCRIKRWMYRVILQIVSVFLNLHPVMCLQKLETNKIDFVNHCWRGKKMRKRNRADGQVKLSAVVYICLRHNI